MVRHSSSSPVVDWREDRRVAAHCRPVTTLACDACGNHEPRSGIIRRVTATGTRISLCYECYEAQTAGEYFGQDEYWGGSAWIPLAKGE